MRTIYQGTPAFDVAMTDEDLGRRGAVGTGQAREIVPKISAAVAEIVGKTNSRRSGTMSDHVTGEQRRLRAFHP